jgi:hypothetical protein
MSLYGLLRTTRTGRVGGRCGLVPPLAPALAGTPVLTGLEVPLDVPPMLRDRPTRVAPGRAPSTRVGDAAISRLIYAGLFYAWQDAGIIPALPTMTASGGALAAARPDTVE